jgi:hypothetical protein
LNNEETLGRNEENKTKPPRFPNMAAKANLAIICGVSAVWVQRGRPSLSWGAIAGISVLFGLSTIVTMVKASAIQGFRQRI